MIEGKTLCTIENNIAIFYESGYYICDGMYVELKTKNEALTLAKQRGRNFIVNKENMFDLIELGFVRDEFAYNEEGAQRETWRKFMGKGNIVFFPNGKFKLEFEGNMQSLNKIQKIIQNIYGADR